MTEQELNKACEIVRDLANEYFGDWEQSCKFEDKFRKAMTEKTNPLFEQALADVDPDTRAEVRRNMEAVVKESLTTEWHKASEELPKDTCEVLICWRERNYILHYPQVAMFYGDADKPSRFENENGMPVMPDYWMPIPEIKED